MPKKYHIHTQPTPPRFTPVGRFGVVDFNENCAGACRQCVKKKCVYNVYATEAAFVRDMNRPVEFMNGCMNCLSCVQNCTKGALTRVVNPEYKWLGDEYWTPDQILSIWTQATTGQLPVSGAGYRGPFSGPGFDSMWTDMSEIVRPTRDGIHGREYISTSVDVGRKLSFLGFDEKGGLETPTPSIVEIPAPFFIDLPRFGDFSESVYESMAKAASELEIFFIIDAPLIRGRVGKYAANLIPRMAGADIAKNKKLIKSARIAQIDDCPDAMKRVEEIKKINPAAIVCVRHNLRKGSENRVSALTSRGVEMIHLCATTHGRAADGEYMKDALRRIHMRLVDDRTRDMVTLAAGGGISLPEHMAKAIICGADMVTIDIPFLIALECRMCMKCARGEACPVEIAKVTPEYGSQRILNLAAAWRNQLLEVLGAMGIREVRRLRGEVGRAMFQEDLERDTFRRLFERKKVKSK